MVAFSLEWFGGPVERRFRRDRPIRELVDLDFAALRSDEHPPELVSRARAAWTYGAYQEYCTGAAFAAIQSALLEVGAPIDLIAMAAGFVEDEMVHAELNARIAVALGGGISPDVDFAKVSPRVDASPLERALSLVVQTCCVGEAFSVPILRGTLKASTHPVVRSVLARIVKDEAPHARFGWWVLEWAEAELTDALRLRLGGVAARALSRHADQIEALPPDDDRPAVAALGWMSASRWSQCAKIAARDDVIAPLAAKGIDVGAIPSAFV